MGSSQLTPPAMLINNVLGSQRQGQRTQHPTSWISFVRTYIRNYQNLFSPNNHGIFTAPCTPAFFLHCPVALSRYFILPVLPGPCHNVVLANTGFVAELQHCLYQGIKIYFAGSHLSLGQAGTAPTRGGIQSIGWRTFKLSRLSLALYLELGRVITN